MKPILIAVLSLSVIFVIDAEAKGHGGNRGPSPQQKKLQAERAEREKDQKKIQEYLDSKDKNHDSQVSKDEYTTDEADKAAAEKKFDSYDTNHDRQLSKTEIGKMLGLGK